LEARLKQQPDLSPTGKSEENSSGIAINSDYFAFQSTFSIDLNNRPYIHMTNAEQDHPAI
jgi:hypothetical protein